MQTKKKGLIDFRRMKEQGEKLTWLTAYDYPTATFEEAAGIDMILVGDSMGNCVYGYPSGTIPVTMDMCIVHCQAVRRGAPNTFVMGDMPFGSYQTTPDDAVRSAVRFLKEAEVDAVKLEGGRRITPMIRAIVDAGMVLCGHIGLTPQSTGQFGGYKAQGRTAESAMEVIKDARAVRDAGAAMLLLEAVPNEASQAVVSAVDVPVIGCGAGPACDGHVCVTQDMLGIGGIRTPRFVPVLARLGETTRAAMRRWVEDIENESYPAPEHVYGMRK